MVNFFEEGGSFLQNYGDCINLVNPQIEREVKDE